MSNESAETWCEFVGTRSKKKYRIVTATPQYFDEIVQHMLYGFVPDEPISRYSELVTCKESLAEMKRVYETILAQGLALLCLTDDSDGDQRIAGINVTAKFAKDDPKYKPDCDKWTKVYEIIDIVASRGKPYESINADSYLGALGLFVLPEFRGDTIGSELLKAREPLCRAKGIAGTCTVFTSIASQKLAQRVGFKTTYEISYEDLFNERPDLHVPKIQEHTKYCKFMCLTYV